MLYIEVCCGVTTGLACPPDNSDTAVAALPPLVSTGIVSSTAEIFQPAGRDFPL